MVTPAALATELLDAYRDRRLVPAPTSREGGLDLASAYAVEGEILRIRKAAGHRPVGLKVGFANKAAWRILKLDTVVWAHMYDDTVRHAVSDRSALSVGGLVAPKIEPEIVFGLNGMPAAGAEPAAVLDAVDWLALGFEIIDCVFPGWQFQPADFVASRGLHAGLIVGTPLKVAADHRDALAGALASCTVRLDRQGETAATGGGRNVLRNPAACLGELAAALRRSTAHAPLQPGDLVSSGTMTESQLIAAGETWTATLEGLDLPTLTLDTTP
jgi:2-oxo-3-hexenedioate decarboxylase